MSAGPASGGFARGRTGRDLEGIPVFSLLGVLAISVILFVAVAVTARLVLGK
jgi:hypothetical protein